MSGMQKRRNQALDPEKRLSIKRPHEEAITFSSS